VNDLRLELFDDGADLLIDAGDVVTANGLAEAVLVSLLSDGRASAEEIEAAGFIDPQGWWGEDPPDRHGSKLWLLTRAKLDADTVLRAQDYCREALSWMIELGVAEEVRVQVERAAGQDRLDVEVQIRRGSAREYSELWAGIVSGKTSESTIGDSRLRIVFR
jgi:phage gp46-like protein